MITAIEAFHNATGQWVRLAEWDDEDEYDAGGWCDKWADRIGTGKAILPINGVVDLSAFSVVRQVVPND